jgi:hypothetical protein
MEFRLFPRVDCFDGIEAEFLDFDDRRQVQVFRGCP